MTEGGIRSSLGVRILSFLITKKETPCYARDFFFNGEGGIRTHAPFRTNGFQDRLVMTTSIPLQSVQTILQFTLFLVKDRTALN